jgi:predicted nuclease with TOPRIM domain
MYNFEPNNTFIIFDKDNDKDNDEIQEHKKWNEEIESIQKKEGVLFGFKNNLENDFNLNKKQWDELNEKDELLETLKINNKKLYDELFKKIEIFLK